ncbi:MAG: hypothetical protein KatS3mg110_4563 [Pirellulaceae bacterium]|nr:MAG: hypothetical protein KatS3mg110_4563 [Pirellulaceae bacterium]
MSINRTTFYNKLYKVLKKYYQPAVVLERPVLEHLLYACCLENSSFDAADEAFALLQQYVDWNEVRVTTVSELAEVMACLTDPVEAGRRLKRCLQSIFEAKYSFDLEYLKKMPLSKAQAELRQFQGVTTFGVQYVSQQALGGHCIPVNAGVYAALKALGVVNDKDIAAERVPALERAIPKSKGVEFASLLHQFGVDFAKGPSARLRQLLKEVVPKFEFPAAVPPGTGSETQPLQEQKPQEAAATSAQAEAATPPAPEAAATSGKKRSGSRAKPKAAAGRKSSAGGEEPQTPSRRKTAAASKSSLRSITKRKPK